LGKARRGGFRFYRPDDLAVDVIKGLMASVPQLEVKRVDDVIVGNAVPEAEQGLQFGRIISARALGIDVPGCNSESLLRIGIRNNCDRYCQNKNGNGGLYHCRRH
jgi:acetyl-CoA acetyltransferase